MDKTISRRNFIKFGALFAGALLLPKLILDIDVPEDVAEEIIKPSLTDGKWHHVAYTSENKFYFDGKEVEHSPLVGIWDSVTFLPGTLPGTLPEAFTVSYWIHGPYAARIELTSGDQLLFAAGMDPAEGLLDG